MEPSSRARATQSLHGVVATSSAASRPWSPQQFANWSEANTPAAERYRDLGELPTDPAGADDLLGWLVANEGASHVRAWVEADATRHVPVIRQLTFDGSKVDPLCMDVLRRCTSLTKLVVEKNPGAGFENDEAIVKAVCSHTPLQWLVLDAHGMEDSSLDALMKGLQDWKAPSLACLDVTYQDITRGKWLAELGRYLTAAPAGLREIHVRASIFPLHGYHNIMPKVQKQLLSSIASNEGLRLESLTIELDSPFETGLGAGLLKKTLALAERSGKLSSLNLRGMCDAMDLVALKKIGALEHLDVSITCFWGGPDARSASSNPGVVALIADRDSLVSLTARGRCFHPSKGQNPSAAALGGAIEKTRLEALDFTDCEFSSEQSEAIVAAIHANRSLIDVRLPPECFTVDQIGVVENALWRNLPDQQLGEAARVALAVVFNARLPKEIAFEVVDGVLEHRRAMDHNADATVMTMLSGSAHAAASEKYANLLRTMEAERIPGDG